MRSRSPTVPLRRYLLAAIDGRPRGPRRSAVVTITVLFAVMAALAISYAASYLLTRRMEIDGNAILALKASLAAETGLSIGIQKAFSSQWPGVDSVVAGGCGKNQSFEVRYLSGDSELTPGNPDYARLPLRITVVAVGKAWRSGQPDYPAISERRVTLELVPRALSPEPNDWNTITSYTVYQTESIPCHLNIPYRFGGKVRFQSALSLADSYPNDASAWNRYLDDLHKMRLAGLPDYRPFEGTVRLPFTSQPIETLYALLILLGVPTQPLASTSTQADLAMQSNLEHYRLYPGGPTYSIPTLSGTLENISLAADPASNPLGLFLRDGNLTILDNVALQGSLYTTGDISVTGSNISFRPVDLASPNPGEERLRIPTLSGRKLHVDTLGTSRTIYGLVGLFGHFHVRENPDATEFAVKGKMFAPEFRIDHRTPWGWQDWTMLWTEFLAQSATATGENQYFPIWLRNTYGLDPATRLRIEPEGDETATRYHWMKAEEPIYVPASRDITLLDPTPALRWSFIRWDSASK